MSEDLDLVLAVGTPLLLSFVAAYALSLRLGVPSPSPRDPSQPRGFLRPRGRTTRVGAFGADPDEAFTQGFDNALFAVMLAAFIGWEAGIAGGVIHGAIRRRLR